MEFISRPELDPEEREAVALALERLLNPAEVPAAYESGWRAQGIDENLGSEDQAPERDR
jgi:hypothetical protein